MDVIDPMALLKFAAALMFVLALMVGLAMAFKKFGQGNNIMSGQKKRMKILEILPIDARRKAILLQRDDREHLIILGAYGETLIESDIESKQDNNKSNSI